MSEPVTTSPGRPVDEAHAEFEAVWGNPRGWRALSIVNHTSIGLRFAVTGGVFFVIAGLLAMMMRSQLAIPHHAFMTAEAYHQAFTMHGTLMMFLFAVPVLEGLACYLIPKMLGARDLVFPRLSAFGYWCYLFGGIIVTSSLFFGVAPNSGWFMYVPLSGSVYTPGINSDFWLLGITFVEISAVAAGVELIVSILRTRAPGMALHQMPIFAWYILVTALMIVVGFPPLILGSILLELERAAGLPFFDVTRGGDPILWQHLFWLFGHPEVYIIFLPAAGIVSTVLPVFARRPLVGYRWAVVAVITTGFISFGLWVHHMFTVGIPQLAQVFFSAASMLVAVPTSIQIFAWLATLWTGRPVMRVPMLWVVGFLVIFVAGGLTGVMLALVPFDWQVHDTHFVVAHMHYVLVGGMLFPLLAGLYYWMPHFSGRMPSERLAKWGFWLTFVGFNGTFLVMHWTGLLGMPRRVYTYDPGLGWEWPNLVSSVFSFVMAAGIAMVLLDFALHFRFGRPARQNPWDADTLEWATDLPPTAYNFASLPSVDSRHPLWVRPQLPRDVAEARCALPHARHGRRETMGCDPVTGVPREVIHLPGNSFLPLHAALTLAVVCCSLLFKAYLVAAVAAAVTVAILLRWSWENGAHPHAAPETHDLPEGLKLHSRTFDGPGLWGMGLTLLADAALFLSLVFGWLYLWTASPGFTAPAHTPLSATVVLGSGAALSVATAWLLHVVRRLKRDDERGLQWQLLGIALLGAVQAGGTAWLMAASPITPTGNAHDAVIAVMLGFLLLHGGLGAVLAALQAWRVGHRYVGAHAPYEPAVLAQLWIFNTGCFWVACVALMLFPAAFGGVP
ncbi:cytochrome c oxidase subunit I [Schlegelella sp. S2-27]|uniref:cytochrome-c oxidase n=1 Tax=Caldimonas mangrovi TaxID=2944811 RepID=A0ABT0YMN1_9BURK|nr:cytochrome c oxidase subunit I [Caldimonas mangrovi]MCM5679694.1 cytochrome c oxidase subunit I [Caldimonas mangrovi]